jgi:hypothetical protein
MFFCKLQLQATTGAHNSHLPLRRTVFSALPAAPAAAAAAAAAAACGAILPTDSVVRLATSPVVLSLASACPAITAAESPQSDVNELDVSDASPWQPVSCDSVFETSTSSLLTSA